MCELPQKQIHDQNFRDRLFRHGTKLTWNFFFLADQESHLNTQFEQTSIPRFLSVGHSLYFTKCNMYEQNIYLYESTLCCDRG